MMRGRRLIQTSKSIYFHDVQLSTLLTSQNTLQVIYALGSAHEKFNV